MVRAFTSAAAGIEGAVAGADAGMVGLVIAPGHAADRRRDAHHRPGVVHVGTRGRGGHRRRLGHHGARPAHLGRRLGVGQRLDLGEQLPQRQVPPAARLLQRLQDHPVHFRRQPRLLRRGRLRGRVELLLQERVRVAFERRVPGEREVEDRAQAVDVRPLIDRPRLHLLRREVGRRAEHLVVHRLGQAELGDLDLVAGDHVHVARRHVAVDHAHLLRLGERLADLQHDRGRALERQRALGGDQVLQGLTADHLGGHVDQPVRGLALVDDLGDPIRRDLAQLLQLAQGAVGHAGVGEHLGVDHLQRDQRASVLGVAGFVLAAGGGLHPRTHHQEPPGDGHPAIHHGLGGFGLGHTRGGRRRRLGSRRRQLRRVHGTEVRVVRIRVAALGTEAHLADPS
jgi:hypothetical protein